MPDIILVDLLVVALAFLAFSTLYSRGKQKKLPFPPGPTRLPVIGNLLDMPAGAEWITYKQWGKLYGARVLYPGVPYLYAILACNLDSDVLHVDVLGTHIVIINSVKAANELLEKRSSVYSDR
jgi:hypothetical protein